MDSESKDTADRHKAGHRGPDGLADWSENTEESLDIKRKKEGQVFIRLSK